MGRFFGSLERPGWACCGVGKDMGRARPQKPLAGLQTGWACHSLPKPGAERATGGVRKSLSGLRFFM